MVLIEPKTEKLQEEPITFETRETVSVAQDEQPEVVLKKTVTFKDENAMSKVLNGTKSAYQKIVSAMGNALSGVSLTTGKTPHQKANVYIKQCWLHMSQNEVDKARRSYDKLRSSYEEMTEGPNKTEVYYEVYDIYTRLSEIRA